MNSRQPSSWGRTLRFGTLFCAVAAFLLSGPLGNLHVACDHHDSGPVQAHACDLCAKIFGNPPAKAATPDLPRVARTDESVEIPVLPCSSLRRVPERGRDPPVVDFLV